MYHFVKMLLESGLLDEYFETANFLRLISSKTCSWKKESSHLKISRNRAFRTLIVCSAIATIQIFGLLERFFKRHGKSNYGDHRYKEADHTHSQDYLDQMINALSLYLCWGYISASQFAWGDMIHYQELESFVNRAVTFDKKYSKQFECKFLNKYNVFI